MDFRRLRLSAGFKVAHYLKVVLFIPLCLFAVLRCFSLLPGWNVITLFLFWFLITPVSIIFLSSKISSGGNILGQAMIALISFYSMMIFMIYEHFESDYFFIMAASFLYNLLVMMVAMIVDRDDKKNTSKPPISSSNS
ncbi:MAG: hypothetical protein ABIR06_06490 [Cyclobacteriaceae bacterium]